MSKGDMTRARIIQQSVPVFNRQGYAGASMSDIMQVTGLKKGGIYRHFESKEELALQTFNYSMTLVNDLYAEAIKSKRNTIERLIAVIHVLTDLQGDTILPGGCPMMNTAIESDDTHPALKASARKAMQLWEDTLVRVVEVGVRRGEVRPTVDAREVAILMIASMEGGLMMTRLHNNPRHLNSVETYLTNYLHNEVKA